MKNIITNHTHAVKEFLREYGIKNIISVKHNHDFVFEALTSDSRIKIITDPVDEDQKQIEILSIRIYPRKKALSVEEQELLVYVAKYNSPMINRFLDTGLCKSQYSTKDIESFGSIVNADSNSIAIKTYWDLDTAAREYFIEILNKVFCANLLR
jgi:hypothetical protein